MRLLFGRTTDKLVVSLPSDLTSIINIIQTASLYMFALFLTGACLSFVMIFVVLLSVFSRWTAFLIMILTLLNGICIIGASVIATVMFGELYTESTFFTTC